MRRATKCVSRAGYGQPKSILLSLNSTLCVHRTPAVRSFLFSLLENIPPHFWSLQEGKTYTLGKDYHHDSLLRSSIACLCMPLYMCSPLVCFRFLSTLLTRIFAETTVLLLQD